MGWDKISWPLLRLVEVSGVTVDVSAARGRGALERFEPKEARGVDKTTGKVDVQDLSSSDEDSSRDGDKRGHRKSPKQKVKPSRRRSSGSSSSFSAASSDDERGVRGKQQKRKEKSVVIAAETAKVNKKPPIEAEVSRQAKDINKPPPEVTSSPPQEVVSDPQPEPASHAVQTSGGTTQKVEGDASEGEVTVSRVTGVKAIRRGSASTVSSASSSSSNGSTNDYSDSVRDGQSDKGAAGSKATEAEAERSDGGQKVVGQEMKEVSVHDEGKWVDDQAAAPVIIPAVPEGEEEDLPVKPGHDGGHPQTTEVELEKDGQEEAGVKEKGGEWTVPVVTITTTAATATTTDVAGETQHSNEDKETERPGSRSSTSSSSSSSSSSSGSAAINDHGPNTVNDPTTVTTSAPAAVPYESLDGVREEGGGAEVKGSTATPEEVQQVSEKKDDKDNKGGSTQRTDDASGSSDSDSDSSDDSNSSSGSDSGDEKKPHSEKELPKESTIETRADIHYARGESRDSDPENTHGGNDPDNVANNLDGTLFSPMPEASPGKPRDGSILPLLEASETALEVKGVMLTKPQVYEVAENLQTRDKIRWLNLVNCGIDDDDVQKIMEALKVSPSNPVLLNLSLNPMTSGGVDHVLNVLKGKPSIEAVVLQGTRLGDSGVESLVDGLLYHHEEKKEQAQADESLQGGIHELDLSDCKFGDQGARSISRLIRSDMDIDTLTLSYNHAVSEQGWRAIGEGLYHNRNLETLTLDHNFIGDEGMEHMAHGLFNNHSVTDLDLNDVGLTERGGRELLELLKRNTTIQEITLMGNKLTAEQMDNIQKYIALNKTVASPGS